MSTKDLTIEQFQKIIWDYYKKNKREFPWRQDFDPYKILISEVMLQQTQTYRVKPKYEAWIHRFPDFKSLATASLSEVLTYWQGLGYNRRAMYLQKTAQKILSEYNSKVPKNPEELVQMPGIGKATAASIIVFAYNIPLPFIETNIRRVFIHHFFSNTQTDYSPQSTAVDRRQTAVSKTAELVSDKQLMPLIEQALDKNNPREWYYALMDYGSMLPKTIVNPNRNSKHYTKQSKFEGSLRQVRGSILRILTAENPIGVGRLQKLINVEPDRFTKALSQLEKEGFIEVKNEKVNFL